MTRSTTVFRVGNNDSLSTCKKQNFYLGALSHKAKIQATWPRQSSHTHPHTYKKQIFRYLGDSETNICLE